MADDFDSAKEHDDFEGPGGVVADSAAATTIKDDGDSIYHRLIKEQRFELEQLKRAAREASPSSKHALERPSSATLNDAEDTLPPSPTSNIRPRIVHSDTHASGGGGGDSGCETGSTSYVGELSAGGRHHYGSSTADGDRLGGGAEGQRYAGVGDVGGGFLAAITRERTDKSRSGAGTKRGEEESGGRASADGLGGDSGRFLRGVRDPSKAAADSDTGRISSRGAVDAQLAAFSAADSYHAKERSSGGTAVGFDPLQTGGGGGGGNVSRRREEQPPVEKQPSLTAMLRRGSKGDEITTAAACATGKASGTAPKAHPTPGTTAVRFTGGDGASAIANEALTSPDRGLHSVFGAVPGAASAFGNVEEGGGTRGHGGGRARTRTPSAAAADGAGPVARPRSGGVGGGGVGFEPTINGRSDMGPPAAIEPPPPPATKHTHVKGYADSIFVGRKAAESPGRHRKVNELVERQVGAGGHLLGSSWAGVGGSSGSYHLGGRAAAGEGGGAFSSASWAAKLVTKREEQSVLVKQLERELASTVSALKDERRERRGQTETLRRKLEETRAAVGYREAELQRRERMTTTLMGELEALQSRCDRLVASREERAEEADKTMARLREADAAAAEARSARAGADAERVRMGRDLQSALAKDLLDSKGECEELRSELETLRRRVEEEGTGRDVGSLRAQVADLERLLETANQRCVALEARLGLLEKELVEAEGGEVEARARLRWALGQLGEPTPTPHGQPRERRDTERSPNGGGVGRGSADNGIAGDPSGQASGDTAEPLERTPGSWERPLRLLSSPRSDEAEVPRAGKGFGGDGSDDGKGSLSGGGRGSEGEADAVASADAVAAVMVGGAEETEYREPNWRSLVPALFPPGWRDFAARGEVGAGTTVGVAVEPEAVGAACMDRPDGAVVDRPTATPGGGFARDEAGGVRGRHDSGGTASGFDATTRAGARQFGGRSASPAGEIAEMDDDGDGASEERREAALDHLTAEELSFALEGGVGMEYGEWRHNDSDGQLYDGMGLAEDTSGTEDGGGFETEGHRVPRYGYGAVDDDAVFPGGHGATSRRGNFQDFSRRRQPAVVRTSSFEPRSQRGGRGAAVVAPSSRRADTRRAHADPSARSRRPQNREPTRASPSPRTRPNGARRTQASFSSSAGREVRGSSIAPRQQRVSVRVPGARAATTLPGPRHGRPPRPAPGTGALGRRHVGAPPSHRAQPGVNKKHKSGAVGSSLAVGDGGGHLADTTDVSLGSVTDPRRTAAHGTSHSVVDAIAGVGRSGGGKKLSRRYSSQRDSLRSSGASRTVVAVGRGSSAAAAAERAPRERASTRLASARLGGGSGGAREHVSLMRRRRGLGSSLAPSRTRPGPGGGDRRLGRGGSGGGLAGAAVNSSTCGSIRAWKP
ncbi:unnamed protein product [Ectocarpus sp. CCAP 1310/34]|nr:unnamed protein product [Ectocarpus sp. CCAP 1310/34]